MSTHHRFYHVLSIVVVITLLFSGLSLSSASAQGSDSAERQINFVEPDHEKGNSNALAGTTWYVATTGSDSNSCSAPGSPCASINGALGKAANGDEVKVAMGIYTGIGTEVVNISKAIALSGGWNTAFTAQQGYSTIDGQGSRQGVFVGVTDVAISRFIVQNCIESGIYIDFWGGATVDKSIIRNNFGPHGGGINNSGILVLNNSSLHHNTADSLGGGINNSKSLTINNSTISYNSAFWSGAIHASPIDASVSLNNVTISHNTAAFQVGGISANSRTGNVTLQNTILANNTGSEGQDCSNKMISQGYNIIENLENCTVTPTTGDKFNIDPGLGQLNPALGIQSLVATSPAIDAGNPAVPGSQSNACLPLDQRAAQRPIDGPDPDNIARCDIGAYEYTIPGSVASLLYFSGSPQVATPGTQLSNPMKVIALDSQSTPVPGVAVKFSAPGSGPSGIFAASGTNISTVFTNADGIATAPTFTANNLKGSYNIVASNPNASSSVTFVITNGYWLVATNGNDVNDCSSTASPCATIQGVLKKPHFSSGHIIRVGLGVFATADFISISKNTTISGGWDSTFTNQIGASTIEDPIGTYPNTLVTLENLTIRNNPISAGLTNSGILTLNRSAVINNKQGIDNEGTLTIINSTISGNGTINSPPSFGGGLDNTNSTGEARATIVNSTISNNRAYSGAGIYNSSTAAGVVILQNSIVAGNFNPQGYGNDCEGGNGDGKFTSLGYNIIGNIGMYNGAVYSCKGNWLATDKVGTQSNPVNPKLNALTNFGNDIWIHPIKPESPAFNGVLSNNCPSIDQRGVSRPQEARCDIGSHEFRFISISGHTEAAGATLSYSDGTIKMITSLANGNYSFKIPETWSGTVTPTHPCFTFSPASRSYSNLGISQIEQNYKATFNTSSDCADISALIGDDNQGWFGLETGASTRASFTGVNSGPVQIVSNNDVPLIGAERVIYKVKGVQTSFTEMMGLPNSELDTVYWLPWYNNVELDTQLRIANATNNPATVTVTIGGVEMPTLNLTAGESTRVSYPVNDGPVKIESNEEIVAAERVIYTVQGTQTSFSEMMALPESQLDTTYWLPWYNNKDLDTQLRIGNVSASTATVHVFIGGDEVTPVQGITLLEGESTRLSYPAVNDGPVQIVSDQNIVAAERVIYKVNNIQTSFSEMMALPNSQLDTTYWLPWYNNKDLDTQLRFANTTNSTATVHIYVGGVEMPDSPFTLAGGESTRVSFASINNGPVQIESDQDIVVAERVIYKVNNIQTSFTEMMALPNTLLDTTYWFPWYNNVGSDTQLRFGVP